jgi:hypothetical protein
MAEAMTKTHHVDLANTGFLLASAALAILAPLETFLFAYAVLGPLHYLTEISWLHDRRYFSQSRLDPVVLITLTGAALVIPAFGGGTMVAGLMLALALLYALTAAYIPANLKNRWLLALIAFPLATLCIYAMPYGTLVFAVLLPTYIHVFLFTTLFMLFGALKAASRVGLLNVAIHVAIMLFLFIGSTHLPHTQALAVWSEQAFEPFLAVNRTILEVWHDIEFPGYAVISSPEGQALLRFMAFAYLYHYLNWFSKTSIIGWHKISPRRHYAIITLWLAAVGIYLYDYLTGFYVLLALSLLHVVLEFPLNHRSFFGILGHVTAGRGLFKNS